jgi:hypothetical protein
LKLELIVEAARPIFPADGVTPNDQAKFALI